MVSLELHDCCPFLRLGNFVPLLTPVSKREKKHALTGFHFCGQKVLQVTHDVIEIDIWKGLDLTAHLHGMEQGAIRVTIHRYGEQDG